MCGTSCLVCALKNITCEIFWSVVLWCTKLQKYLQIVVNIVLVLINAGYKKFQVAIQKSMV